MATAFAERERDRRELDVDIVTGGTDPADTVHDEVVTALSDVGIDIGDRTPRHITPEDIEDADYVVSMGCSVDEFAPDDWDGTASRWSLDHPGGDLDAVRSQRDEIENRVVAFFDQFEDTH